VPVIIPICWVFQWDQKYCMCENNGTSFRLKVRRTGFLLFCGADDQTQGLTYAKQMLCHWTILIPPEPLSFGRWTFRSFCWLRSL
jgi:hypothetical protein